MKTPLCLLLALPCLLLSCRGEESTPPEPGTTPAADEAAPTANVAEAVEYEAVCGHVLPEVGHCGNYIKVDGKWVVLEYPSLGAMEYCQAGEEGATVEVAGELLDGKFVATSYARID